MQGVSQQHHKGLSLRINPQMRTPEFGRCAIPEKRNRRKLTQRWLVNDQRQAAIATRHRMADPVAFGCIEKKYLVCFGYGLVVSNMTDIDTSVRKHKLCGLRALFGALVPATASAVGIPNCNGARI